MTRDPSNLLGLALVVLSFLVVAVAVWHDRGVLARWKDSLARCWPYTGTSGVRR